MDTTDIKAQQVLVKLGGDPKIDPLTLLLIVKIILFLVSVFIKWKFTRQEAVNYMKDCKGFLGFFKRRAIRKAMPNLEKLDFYLPVVMDVLCETTLSEFNSMGRRAEREGYYHG